MRSFILFLLLVSVASGATYYIDPTGSDSNDGLTTGTAWATPRKVTTSTFLAGDAILLKAGSTFTTNLVVPSSGSIGSPITIGSYGTGALPIINLNGTANCFTISSKNYITVTNIETRSGSSDGFYITGSSHDIILSNCVASLCQTLNGNGFHPDGTASGTILNCISHDNQDNGFSQHDTGTWTLINMTNYNNANCGIYNINSSTCMVVNCVCYSNVNHGIAIDTGIITVTGSLLFSNALAGLKSAVGGSMFVTNTTSRNNKWGANFNASGGVGIMEQCRLLTNWLYGVELNQGKVLLRSNTFSGTNTYAVFQNGTSIQTNFWSLYTDCAGVNVTAGGFYISGGVHYNDSNSLNHSAYRIAGGGITNVIENCFINGSSGFALRNDTFPVQFQNIAVRNCTSGNYSGSTGTVTNCIGDDATLPLTGGSIRSATFANYFQSVVPTDPTFAVPKTTSTAYKGGGYSVSGMPSYFNGFMRINPPNIGAFGLAEWPTNYIEPNWTGLQNGTYAQPWSNLTASAWNTINSQLSNANVTIYFSARAASVDTNQIYAIGAAGMIDLTKKTNTAFYLTLDGRNFYNSSDTVPNWITYGGTNRCVVRNFDAQHSDHAKRSNITIDGFTVKMDASGKLIAIAGDNWIVRNCNAYMITGATNGPGVLLVPTADAAHQGSSSYVAACTNIVIHGNTIHDTQGEAIYLGGGGSTPGDAGSGYPSHAFITVVSNEIFNAGTLGGQGDGIDVKGGLEFLNIQINTIHDLICTNINRAIVMQGQYQPIAGQETIIERNYIYSCTNLEDAAIALSDTWGMPQSVTIRNNIIANINRGATAVAGVKVYTSTNLIGIYNNTIFNASGYAVLTTAGGIVGLTNNLFLSNNGGGDQVSLVGTISGSDFNSHNFEWGYGSEGVNTVSNGVGVISTNNFQIVRGSSLFNAGTAIESFSNDFVNTIRPVGGAWDIGAYELTPAHTNNAQGRIAISGRVQIR